MRLKPSLQKRAFLQVCVLIFSGPALSADCPPDYLWGDALRYTARIPNWTKPSIQLDAFLKTAEINRYDMNAMAKWLPECSKNLSPEDLACARPYLDVIQKQTQDPKRLLRMDEDDETYRKKYLTGYLDRIPAPLKDPKLYELFGRGKKGACDQVVNKLRENPGWLVTKVRDPDFSDTIVVVVPGKDQDTLFQFRARDDGSLQFPNSITVLKTENGKKLERPKLIYEGMHFDRAKAPCPECPTQEGALRLTSLPEQYGAGQPRWRTRYLLRLPHGWVSVFVS